MRNNHFDSVGLDNLRSRSLRPDSSPLRPIVLVVDDERVIADTLGLILSESGFASLVAYDAEGAMEIAELVPPDLLLTDVVMPHMSGMELAEEFSRLWPNCRVMLFSGQASTIALPKQIPGTGRALNLVAKPVHPSVLLSKIQELMTTAN